jgi:hypothetical protein
VDIVPKDIRLSFPLINDLEHLDYKYKGLKFQIDLKRSAKPCELPSKSRLDSLGFTVSIQQESS